MRRALSLLFLAHAATAGPPIPAGMVVRADEAGVARARAFLEELRDVLRVDDPSAFVLERATAVTNPWGQEVVFVNFKQTWRGLDVWHQSEGGEREELALVRLRFKGTDLALFGSDAVPALAVADEAILGEDEAAHRALDAVGTTAVAAVRTRSYVSVRGSRAFLARDVEVRTVEPEHRWRFVFDARTGELVERRDDLRHAGTVTGNVQLGCLEHPGSAFQVRPASTLWVGGLAGASYTNSAGDFFINVLSCPAAIQGGFRGAWVDVQDQSGNGNVTFNRQAQCGVPVNLVLNPTNVEAESAEAAAYHWTTRTHDLIASAWPGFNGLILLPANVNRPTPCSSSWDGTSINFGRAGNGCNNTAYLDVVAHEYGHAFHDWFHGSVNPAGFSEGIGDHLAFFVTGSREVGRSFFTNGSALRDYRPGGAANLTQWPCAGCPSARAGEVWAGFTMDLLDRLVASLGPAGGRAVWTAITIPMYAANPSDEVDALIEVYLLDDNDADLSNGTPHCADLTAAANRHSIPVPWGLPSTCGVPPLPVAPEYRAPVPVVELSGANYDSDPCLGGGERTIWWVSDRPGGRGGTDVWTASRPDLTSPWGEPVNVTEVNSPSNELGVEVGPNELEMFVVSNRPGGEGGYDLWYSTRPRTRDPWSTPVPVPFLNTSANELDPSFRGDGLELFFAADVGQPNLYFVYSTTRTHLGAPWDFLRTVLATNLSMGGPSISPDGKTLSVSVLENSDWKYRRYQRRGEVFGFTFWRFLDEINTPGQSVGDLDADEPGSGFSFWYSRVSDFGGAELWRADRILPLLGGPRSAAATESTTFTLRRDPGDYGFIVIALDALPATPIVGVTGPLLIVPLLTVAQGVHDTAGLVRWPTTIANAPGVIVHLQGLTQDPQGRLYLSNRHSFLHLP